MHVSVCTGIPQPWNKLSSFKNIYSSKLFNISVAVHKLVFPRFILVNVNNIVYKHSKARKMQHTIHYHFTQQTCRYIVNNIDEDCCGTVEIFVIELFVSHGLPVSERVPAETL